MTLGKQKGLTRMEEQDVTSRNAGSAQLCEDGYTPIRLRGIQRGDTVTVRSNADLLEDDRRGIVLRCGWNPEMSYLCGKVIVVDEDMWDNMQNHMNIVWTAPANPDGSWSPPGGWRVSLDMLEFHPPRDPTPTTATIPATYNYNFDVPSTETDIDNMISKVDKMRFKKLLAVGTEGGFENVRDRIVDTYLRQWAIAKFPFYKLFGEKLMLTSTVEVDITREEMDTRRDEIALEFPKYAATLMRNNIDEWMNNRVDGGDDLFRRVADKIYSRGTKLTKFYSTLIGDRQLDDALANCLSDRKVKTTIVASIDPYDYLTASTNHHDWQSCYHLKGGAYMTGTLSMMLDTVSVIGYRDNGHIYDYSINGIKWRGNSKAWREAVYIDRRTSCMIFSRQYPGVAVIDKSLRSLLEGHIARELGFEDRWTIATNSAPGYHKGSDCMYHDVESGYNHWYVSPKFQKKSPSFTVGEDTLCTQCGYTIDSAKEHFDCRDCSGHRNEDEDEDYYEEDDE